MPATPESKVGGVRDARHHKQKREGRFVYSALLCFALLALLCFALLCFALLCFALLCFALLCFALHVFFVSALVLVGFVMWSISSRL